MRLPLDPFSLRGSRACLRPSATPSSRCRTPHSSSQRRSLAPSRALPYSIHGMDAASLPSVLALPISFPPSACLPSFLFHSPTAALLDPSSPITHHFTQIPPPSAENKPRYYVSGPPAPGLQGPSARSGLAHAHSPHVHDSTVLAHTFPPGEICRPWRQHATLHDEF